MEAYWPPHVTVGVGGAEAQRGALGHGVTSALHLSVEDPTNVSSSQEPFLATAHAIFKPDAVFHLLICFSAWTLSLPTWFIDVFPAPGPVPGVKWLNVITSIE